MQATPLDTVQNHLADGNAIPMIRGTLTHLWERKSGKHANGDWSIQNGSITDGQTTMKVLFKDRPEVGQEWKNQEVVITGFVSPTHGLSGVYAIDEDYPKGTITRKLKVTGTGNIEKASDFDQAGGHPEAQPEPQNYSDGPDEAWPDAPQQQQAPPQQAPPQQQATRPPAQRAEPHSATSSDLADAKRTLVQIANLHVLCRMAVTRQEAPLLKEITGRDLPEGEIQAATSSLFIKADKIGLHTKMPARPVTAADFPA